MGASQALLKDWLIKTDGGKLARVREYLSIVLYVPLIFVYQQHVRSPRQPRSFEADKEKQRGANVAHQPQSKLHLRGSKAIGISVNQYVMVACVNVMLTEAPCVNKLKIAIYVSFTAQWPGHNVSCQVIV